jgi:hypothetical protein
MFIPAKETKLNLPSINKLNSSMGLDIKYRNTQSGGQEIEMECVLICTAGRVFGQ